MHIIHSPSYYLPSVCPKATPLHQNDFRYLLLLVFFLTFISFSSIFWSFSSATIRKYITTCYWHKGSRRWVFSTPGEKAACQKGNAKKLVNGIPTTGFDPATLGLWAQYSPAELRRLSISEDDLTFFYQVIQPYIRRTEYITGRHRWRHVPFSIPHSRNA